MVTMVTIATIDSDYLFPGDIDDENIFVMKMQVVTRTTFESLQSCIRRCVEYGYITQLLLLMENLDYLTSICSSETVQKQLDTRLLLRKCDPYAYTIAKSYGFEDRELEKRVVMLQRLFRKQSVAGLIESFSGPTPEEYMGDDCELDETGEGMYWGYRHASYYLRWNRRGRVHFLQLAKKHDWYGNCRMQAYTDVVESGDETYTDTFFHGIVKIDWRIFTYDRTDGHAITYRRNDKESYYISSSLER